MDAISPYQPADIDHRRPRRSLLVIVSAGLGSITALLVLNLVVRPPRATPVFELELAPAAATVETTMAPAATAPAATAPSTTVFAVPVATLAPPPIAVVPIPASTTPGPPRWFPPGTPEYVRAAVLDNENLDVVAPIGDGATTYFSVSARARAACGGAVYRITQGSARELVDPAGFLFPRGDGRWLATTSYTGNDCRPFVVTVHDTVNATSRPMTAAGWFNGWSTAHARFVMFDYVIGRFTLYDAPSATALGLGVAPAFARELDERVGPRPPDRPGWVMGRVSFLAEGDLVAHIQCLPDACPDDDTITGWFFVTDGQVPGESARVPDDKAPPFSFYCGV